MVRFFKVLSMALLSSLCFFSWWSHLMSWLYIDGFQMYINVYIQLGSVTWIADTFIQVSNWLLNLMSFSFQTFLALNQLLNIPPKIPQSSQQTGIPLFQCSGLFFLVPYTQSIGNRWYTGKSSKVQVTFKIYPKYDCTLTIPTLAKKKKLLYFRWIIKTAC